MTYKPLVYEVFLLVMVAFTLLFVAWKNKGIKELLWFFGGILTVTISKAYVFFGSEALIPLFYLTTAVGYFMIAFSVVKLANYLRSVKVLELRPFTIPLQRLTTETL